MYNVIQYILLNFIAQSIEDKVYIQYTLYQGIRKIDNDMNGNQEDCIVKYCIHGPKFICSFSNNVFCELYSLI